MLPVNVAPDGFRNHVLQSLPFIRNNAAIHGAGADDTNMPASLANLAVNLAAALDTYFIDEYVDGGMREWRKKDDDGACLCSLRCGRFRHYF